MPHISVIVPVYNVEKYLHRCVDSILVQTFTDFELILVDDGSPDNCGKICDEYAKKDSRIHVIHKENGGLASARAAGIQRATGEYISFCDSDDYIKNDFLETLFNTIIANECQCVSSMFYLTTDNFCKDTSLDNINGLYVLRSSEDTIEHISTLLQNISGWEMVCKLFRLDLIKKHGIVDAYLDVCIYTGSYAEDLCFYLLYLFHCERVYYLDYCGYYYYQRTDSLIHNSSQRVHLNEMKEVSYGLFQYVNVQCDRQLYKNYPLIHLCIIAISFREIEDYQEISQITEELSRIIWYKKITKKSLGFRKSLEKICGKNKAFKISNTAFFTIHRKYWLFKWLDIIFYKFFAER